VTLSRRLAAFVSPHGFGHAARAAALLDALHDRLPELEIELWTSVPRWFFEESLGFPFRYREVACDVGLVQRSPVEEDLPASLAALERLWMGEEGKARTRDLGAALVASGADLVLCDIAPLGLEAAREAGIPSVLVENFTWDWIYEPLVDAEPAFAAWIPFLRQRFALADLHLQLEPACAPAARAVALPPVARAPRTSREEVRARLGVPAGDALVLVSLGGVEHRLENFTPLFDRGGATFVLPGASDDEASVRNLRLLPHRSPVHHPDLVAASDLVVGKLGYSTVAEAVAAGTRMLYVPRPGFRESAVLEKYVGERLPSAPISMDQLETGRWAERVPEILSRPRPAPSGSRGAEVGAAAISRFLELP
jgi:UDP:flavonoid glycosyltransferase YjiC (YdhE family)